MALLRRLDAWAALAREGTWRDFSLHARGDTKLVTGAERAWLERQLDMRSLGIESHVPLLLFAGPLRLDGDTRIDLPPALPVGLPPAFWSMLRAAVWRGAEPFEGYLVVENRTTFDRLLVSRGARNIVIWCPGCRRVLARRRDAAFAANAGTGTGVLRSGPCRHRHCLPDRFWPVGGQTIVSGRLGRWARKR